MRGYDFGTPERRQVTLTYMPEGRMPVEERLNDCDGSDVHFMLACLRKRKTGTAARPYIDWALSRSGKWQNEYITDSIDTAIEKGLGRWRMLVPLRVQRRIAARLMMPLGQGTVDLAGAVGEMTARLEEIEYRQRHILAQQHAQRTSRPTAPAGPHVNCKGPDCKEWSLLDPLAEGWTRHHDGIYCPDHTDTDAPAPVSFVKEKTP